MEFSGVYHKTSEQMSYALDEDRLIVNIKTGYDVKQIFIHYGDPYEAGILGGKEKWIGKREEMIYKKRLPYQIWWTTTLLPEYKRCKYYFELRTEKEVWYYFEDGFLTEEQLRMDGRMQQCFIVPWMNPADINRTPAWVNETIWYQIFPDRFFNGDTSNDLAQMTSRGATDYEYIKEWYTWPENPEQETLNPEEYPENAFVGDGNWSNEIYGGDLKGITERVEYLKALGVSVIYLNPVFHSISSHRYDATDYTKIDPVLGDLGDFTELVEVAEANDMHIVLDGVFNHVSDDSISVSYTHLRAHET